METAVIPGRVQPTPVQPRRPNRAPRIIGLDVARALAVFGMLGAHVGAVAPDVATEPATWLGIVNGRSSILFAILAGVSMALLSGRTVPLTGGELARARTRLLVRAAWVFAIGGALEALGTDIDVILGVYAVLFVLALPFLRWPPRRLLVMAGVLAVLTPPVDLLLAQYLDTTGASEAPFVSLAVTGAYPALIWWTFILVGLAVGRCDLGSGQVRARLATAGAGLAVLGYSGGWLTGPWALADPDAYSERPDGWDPAWLAGARPHSGTTFEITGSVGVALVVIVVCLVVADRLPTATSPVASVGSMALTVYSAQIVAIWATGTEEYVDNRTWVAYLAVTVVLATTWRLLLGRGPLERLLTWSSVRVAP
ncbi:heparan-alpha-glucosaminide N-acetyltransferase domain-containing protein [Geodermatophilus sabuli]|nr:heparan-alpha-glucosaminide N-acetyltransferase domain-containing protein [Geodermatophilus sabuli]MBB3081863.1 putative membrane protein YeiB [Geodermatophilus sabuli]